MIKLSDIADITIGTTFNRVSASAHDDVVELKTISMQDVSYYCDKTEIKPDNLINKINSEKISNCLFTKRNDVVLGMTSRNAMVIDDSRTNQLLLSNFLCIRIRDLNTLDPNYLCWLLNDSSEIQKIFDSAMQGSANVHVLKAQDVRNLEIPIVEIEKQVIIGKLYMRQLELRKVDKRIYALKNMLITNKLNQTIKGDN